MSADRWIATSFTGHCGETKSAGNCDSGDKGSLGIPSGAPFDFASAVDDCLQRCARCSRCRYISVSVKWRDCSWYHRCERSRDVLCFRSGPSYSEVELRTHAPSPPASSWPSNLVSSVAILQASDRAPPLPLEDVVQRGPAGRWVPRPELAGKGIRSLTAAVNRAFAATHGYDYVYARIIGGCGRHLVAWCQVPVALSMLMERDDTASSDVSAYALGQRVGRPTHTGHHRYSWVLAVDEDVAFNSAFEFSAFLERTRAPPVLAGHRGRPSCHGRCQPSVGSAADLLDSDCADDHHVASEAPCLIVAKEIGGWPGINVGARFYRNGRITHRLLHEWWSWPMRLPKGEGRQYLHGFPGEQNTLNDAILTNDTYSGCVHVAPNHELYGPPGRFTRHFTGVSADKEAMFLDHFSSGAVGALLRFPTWAETACTTVQRQMSMPANAGGTAAVTVSYTSTRHCLNASLASTSLRERLWPTLGARLHEASRTRQEALP